MGPLIFGNPYLDGANTSDMVLKALAFGDGLGFVPTVLAWPDSEVSLLNQIALS